MVRADWFEFAGRRSTELGIYALKLPAPALAQERVKWEEIAGRSGKLAMLEGQDIYDALELEIECFCRNLDGFGEIAAWLRGSGELVLGNRPDGYYIGRVQKQIDFEKLIAARDVRTFTINFLCEPFFYHAAVPALTLPGGAGTLVNPGNAPSTPVWTIHGTGSVTLTITGADGTVQEVSLSGMTDGIVLDGEGMDATNLAGTQLANQMMSGDFPVLQPGKSEIAWESDEDNGGGSITSIELEPRWRSR